MSIGSPAGTVCVNFDVLSLQPSSSSSAADRWHLEHTCKIPGLPRTFHEQYSIVFIKHKIAA